jgi:hypothetical protein
MNADAQLRDAYAEWRRLAETEGEAIRARDWQLLLDCQHALQQLQPRIIRYTDDAQHEWTRLGVDRSDREQGLRLVISELIELEWRNDALLNVVAQTARAEMNELEQASQNLRRVQRSYAPARPAAWTSFS